MCELVEVLSVTYKGGGGSAPSGTISAFDGKRGQILYRRDQPPSGSAAQNDSNKDVQLVLTGPYRAISAEGCVAIVLDLQHEGCKYKQKKPPEIFLDIYDSSTKYDEAVTKKVRTCSCEVAPVAEVTYALLSDAVEAIFEAKLLLRGPEEDDPAATKRREDHPAAPKRTEGDHAATQKTESDPADSGCYVHRIIARHLLGEVVLFQSDDENTPDSIPLDRSVLAVPLTSSLEIDVELRGPWGGETKKDTKTCQPGLNEEQLLYFHGDKVQVNITYSD